MSRRRQRWSYTAGSRPCCVRVYERESGSVIQAAIWDPTLRGGEGGERRASLRHRDRDRAIAYADREASKLREGTAEVTAPRPTLGRIFPIYLRERTPDKSPRMQSEDQRQAEMFTRLWGRDFDLRRLSCREWDSFKRLRMSGAVDPRGNPVAEQDRERHKAGPRTVERDLRFLRAVCRWATEYRDGSGHQLLQEDPTRGFSFPREVNPKRPVASHDRVDAIRKVCRQVRMEVNWGGKRRKVQTYLPEVFELVVGTGSRIGAVRSLLSTAIESCTGLAIENCTLGGGDEPLVRRFLLCSCSLSLRG